MVPAGHRAAQSRTGCTSSFLIRMAPSRGRPQDRASSRREAGAHGRRATIRAVLGADVLAAPRGCIRFRHRPPQTRCSSSSAGAALRARLSLSEAFLHLGDADAREIGRGAATRFPRSRARSCRGASISTVPSNPAAAAAQTLVDRSGRRFPSATHDGIRLRRVPAGVDAGRRRGECGSMTMRPARRCRLRRRNEVSSGRWRRSPCRRNDRSEPSMNEERTKRSSKTRHGEKLDATDGPFARQRAQPTPCRRPIPRAGLLDLPGEAGISLGFKAATVTSRAPGRMRARRRRRLDRRKIALEVLLLAPRPPRAPRRRPRCPRRRGPGDPSRPCIRG